MAVPVLSVPLLATSPTEVLLGYGGLVLSSVFVLVALIGLLRGRRPTWRSLATVPVAVALAVVSHAWLTDTWRSWRHDQCLHGDSSYCNTTANARPPLWPF